MEEADPMKKVWQLLLKMGILFGLLGGMMLLGGVFEGGVALPAGLCGLALTAAALLALAHALARCEGCAAAAAQRGARAEQSACAVRPVSRTPQAHCRPARSARRAEGLRVA